MATLFGLWCFPAVFCIYRFWWRFLVSWSTFSVATLFIASRAVGRHISGSTPRLVYKWFLFLHTASYVFGMCSYFLVLGALFGLHTLIQVEPHRLMDAALMLLFYGLYYGVLSRDFAEICTDKMAAHIGYYNKDGLPGRILEPNVCAVCGNELRLCSTGQRLEKTCRLNCNHMCHEFCIRGWCIVGKKDICPYCKERVDLARTLQNPWQKPHLFYGQLLDWIRYLLAWQPLIIIFVQGINYVLGLE
ncbi:unnamed protein product [Soboliphyme baturini]|uniref:RING-type domain-containing protein n=1 Tax=Soboliphyme baturini TaxID=241478 RepID=A0A183I996_9BILA|nr:unnamed protein product [Soboliphyme baturini]